MRREKANRDARFSGYRERGWREREWGCKRANYGWASKVILKREKEREEREGERGGSEEVQKRVQIEK